MNTSDRVITPVGPGVVIRFQTSQHAWRHGRPHREWWALVRYPNGEERLWPAGNVRRLRDDDPPSSASSVSRS